MMTMLDGFAVVHLDTRFYSRYDKTRVFFYLIITTLTVFFYLLNKNSCFMWAAQTSQEKPGFLTLLIFPTIQTKLYRHEIY